MTTPGWAHELGKTTDERRERLAADVKEFLANGGVIKQVLSGASASEPKRDAYGRAPLTLGKAGRKER